MSVGRNPENGQTVFQLVRPRIIAILILLAVGATLFFRHSQDLFSDQGNIPTDFKVYLLAVERARIGINPYVPSEETPYKYSPGALTPFYFLPPQKNAAWMVFKFICLSSWIVAILIGVSLTTWRQVLLLILGIAISWKGLLETLDYGQIEFILLLFTVVAGHFLEQRRLFSGFLLGCLPWLKLPWGLLILPYGFASIRAGWSEIKKFLGAYLCGTFVLSILAPSFIFGPAQIGKLMASWLVVLQVQPPELFLGDENQSLWSTLSRWISHGPILGGMSGVLIVILCMSLLLKAVLQKRTVAEVGALAWITPWLILTQLLSPLGWRSGSMLLIGAPFLFRVAAPSRRKSLYWLLCLAVFLLLLLQQNPIAQFIGFSHWTDLHHWGAVTLFWILILALCTFWNEPRPIKETVAVTSKSN